VNNNNSGVDNLQKLGESFFFSQIYKELKNEYILNKPCTDILQMMVSPIFICKYLIKIENKINSFK
jgi:hypothetical protein